MAAVTENWELEAPLTPSMQVVNVTAAASGDTFQSKFGKVVGAVAAPSATKANLAGLAADATSNAGEVDLTWTGAATDVSATLIIFGR